MRNVISMTHRMSWLPAVRRASVAAAIERSRTTIGR
jgi:hypothetical protein